MEAGHFLSPKGNLFKHLKLKGDSDLQYFDTVGNPLDWFLHRFELRVLKKELGRVSRVGTAAGELSQR
jgi:hypothetical protein